MRTDPTAPVADDILEALPDLVFIVDAEGTLRYANRTCEDQLGWDASDFLGRSALDLVHPDDLNLVAASLVSIQGKPLGALISMRVRRSDGGWRRIEVRGRVGQIGEAGPLIILVGRTVEDRHGLDLDAGDEDVLRAVMNTMPAMVVLVDAHGRLRSVNAAVTRYLGHDPEHVLGRSLLSFMHPDDRPGVIDSVQTLAAGASFSLDARLRRSDGEYEVVDFTVTNMLDDDIVRSYVVSGQIAESLLAARSRMEFLASHDTRTGLLNRDGFHRAATELLNRTRSGLGLVLIDIEHFRSVNELYGEPVGDLVLRQIGERLDQIRWPDIVCARLGGDEFVIAIGTPTIDAIDLLRERIDAIAAEPMQVEGRMVNIGLRLSSVFEYRPSSVETLLARASNELVSRKRRHPAGTDVTWAAVRERRAQVEQLQRGLAGGEIRPWFQPIVTADGTVTAVEALVRWEHPVRGVLAAGHVLPLIQLAGLHERFDELVLAGGVDFAKTLDSLGFGHIEVHINVEPKQLANPGFASQVLRQCERSGVEPRQLVVELTETDLLSPDRVSLDNMTALRRAGVGVAIDDFGTGYSSLSHLLELPVNTVKIDRRFIAGIDVDPTSTSLTTAIVGLCESLELACIAEGVEQPYQRDRLSEIGCHSFQGWLYAPAEAPERLVEMLPRIAQVAPQASTAGTPK